MYRLFLKNSSLKHIRRVNDEERMESVRSSLD